MDGRPWDLISQILIQRVVLQEKWSRDFARIMHERKYSYFSYMNTNATPRLFTWITTQMFIVSRIPNLRFRYIQIQNVQVQNIHEQNAKVLVAG